MYFMNNALRKRIGERLFYIVFGLRMVSSLITSSLLYEKYVNILNPFLNVCNLLVLFLLIAVILFCQSYRVKEFIVICVFSVIFQAAASRSGQGFLFLTWLFVCASKNIDIKTVAQETLVISLSVLVILCGLTIIGVIDVSIGQRADGLMRYSIGYSNPNSMGYVVFQLLIALTIKKDKHYFSYFMVLFGGFLLSNNVLNCRSVSICIVLLGIFILMFGNQNGSQFKNLGFVIAIAAPLFSIYLSTIYNPKNSWMLNLDKMLSWRITYAGRYIEKYGFSLVGADMDLTLLGALDNAYVRAAVFYGMIPLVIYTYGVAQLFICKNNSRIIDLICVIVMMLYGLMESYIFVINCNFTLLVLADVIYKKHSLQLDKLLRLEKFGKEN